MLMHGYVGDDIRLGMLRNQFLDFVAQTGMSFDIVFVRLSMKKHF